MPGMLTLTVVYFLETGVREAFCRPRKEVKGAL